MKSYINQVFNETTWSLDEVIQDDATLDDMLEIIKDHKGDNEGILERIKAYEFKSLLETIEFVNEQLDVCLALIEYQLKHGGKKWT